MSSPGHGGAELLGRVREALVAYGPAADLDSVRFLAAGEYTYNYRVTIGESEAVLRVVTGSQMGLTAPDQALYEAHALELLAATASVPTLIHVEPAEAPIGYPYLLLGYLRGRPLDYQRDLVGAARCVAAIHRLPASPGHRLQDHSDPVRSILDETELLVAPLAGPEWTAVRALRARVARTPPTEFAAVRDDLAIINTDLNSHNFIVDEARVWLIDWEKARIGPTLLDVAHFLLPTTTLWRAATAARLTAGQRETFIRAYLNGRPELDADAYRAALRPAMRLAAARAVAWCAWALAASTRGERAIENEETLEKSRLYTSAAFLDELAEELWG